MESLQGHDYTWERFVLLDPVETSMRSGATFDAVSNCYTVKSFGQEIYISASKRKVWGESEIADFIINKTGHFFDLAVLWWLISAKKIELSDEMMRPSDIKCGQIFVAGTHVLPLEKIADKFGNDLSGFVAKGTRLGAESLDFGDAAIRLYPFPGLPVSLILWQGDDEFPARADFFFDSTCDKQLPTDVLWATAMVCVLLMCASV